MQVKLTATVLWTVDPKDVELARRMTVEHPIDTILEYLGDAQHFSPGFSGLDATAEVVEREGG